MGLARAKHARRAPGIRLAVTILATACGLASSALAEPETAGFAVAPAHASDEASATTIPDGLGGAFVAFKAGPPIGTTGTASIYVSRVDANALPVPGWTPVQIAGLYLQWELPAIVASVAPDRVWVQADFYYPGGSMPFLSRSVGAFGLTSPDSSLAASRSYSDISALGLPTGRVLLANKGSSLQVAFIEPDGQLTEVPVPIEPPIPFAFIEAGPPLAADAVGGAWALAELANYSTPGDPNLYAVRIAPDGNAVLTPAYRAVCLAPRQQEDPVLASDGANGLFVAWTDRRDLAKASDVYATHLLADGSLAPGWPAWGKAIASFAGDQFQPSIAPDGAGGVWLAWTDSRSGTNDIYHTHLAADGTPRPGHVAGGKALCAATGSQVDVRLAPDGEGGIYAVWLDQRDGELDLYGQHLHSSGDVIPPYEPDGLPICTEGTTQSSPAVLLSSPHHALATWIDTRTGTKKIYAVALPPDGNLADTPKSSHGPGLGLRAARDPARDVIELLVSAPDVGSVRVTLHDLSGRRLDERVLAGPLASARVRFDGTALSPGLYFARAVRDHDVKVTRLSLLR